MPGWFILQKGIGGRGFPQVPFFNCRQFFEVYKVVKLKVERHFLVVSCE